jgi:hypothetical protein
LFAPFAAIADGDARVLPRHPAGIQHDGEFQLSSCCSFVSIRQRLIGFSSVCVLFVSLAVACRVVALLRVFGFASRALLPGRTALVWLAFRLIASLSS